MQAASKAPPDGALREGEGWVAGSVNANACAPMMGENDPQIGARRLPIYLRSGIEFLAGAERKRNSLRLENAIENMTGECVFFWFVR